jgi:hypothetical protein
VIFHCFAVLSGVHLCLCRRHLRSCHRGSGFKQHLTAHAKGRVVLVDGNSHVQHPTPLAGSSLVAKNGPQVLHGRVEVTQAYP